MGHGIEVYNSSGQLVFNSDSRLGRVIGSVRLTGAAGSITDARFSSGTPFHAFIADATVAARTYPVISVAGTTISWSYSGAYPIISGLLIYGAY